MGFRSSLPTEMQLSGAGTGSGSRVRRTRRGMQEIEKGKRWPRAGQGAISDVGLGGKTG